MVSGDGFAHSQKGQPRRLGGRQVVGPVAHVEVGAWASLEGPPQEVRAVVAGQGAQAGDGGIDAQDLGLEGQQGRD